MAATALCTNATANGYYPSAAGISPGAASYGFVATGVFPLPTELSLEVSNDGGTNWAPIPGAVSTGPNGFTLTLRVDQFIRAKIVNATSLTSISSSID